MWKVCIGAGSIALSSFTTYAIIASTISGQNPPWYLAVFLWLSLCALLVFLVTGGIYLYRLIWGKKLDIDVGESEAKSRVSTQGNKHALVISYTLRTNHPPVHIARVILHIQGVKLRSIDPSFNVDNTNQSYESTFEMTDDEHSWRPLKIEDKYHLSILALGRDWESKEFNIPHLGQQFDVPILDMQVAPLPVTVAKPSLFFDTVKYSFGSIDNNPVVEIGIILSATGVLIMESAELEISGKRTPCYDWIPNEIGSGYGYSRVIHCRDPLGLTLGRHTIRLLIFANDEWWSSAKQLVAYLPPD